MISEAATESVALSFCREPDHVREAIEHIGDISAAVYPIDDRTVEEMIAVNYVQRGSRGLDLVAKLRGNLASAFARVRRIVRL